MSDLTVKRKIDAMVEQGLAYDEEDARAQLEDMGELDEGEDDELDDE